eukprot:7958783-Pyramimonas_sp.AAC.1
MPRDSRLDPLGPEAGLREMVDARIQVKSECGCEQRRHDVLSLQLARSSCNCPDLPCASAGRETAAEP